MNPLQNPEYRALLQGVFVNPCDDATRLIVADWLDENGESERADFIRAQVQLARLLETSPFEKGADIIDVVVASESHLAEIKRLQNRIKAYESRRKEWTQHLTLPTPHQLGVPMLAGDVTWRRGWIDAMCMHPSFVGTVYMAAIRREHPVQTVTLTHEPTGYSANSVQSIQALYAALNTHGANFAPLIIQYFPSDPIADPQS